MLPVHVGGHVSQFISNFDHACLIIAISLSRLTLELSGEFE